MLADRDWFFDHFTAVDAHFFWCFRRGTQFNLDWITQYYKEEQYQNPTLQAASAEVLNGLRKAGLK